ncbi:hypothetical protein [Agromyces soli]|uniref:DUF4190 domain-containing protein n=1 Tax=Agromyces soli TaxID=659012 RepID=A0ABY4ATE6_9MICO|nr:hypothetical protein [Agromyces soli]UOE26432.1 hypothetical protein MTP13_01215 [Agromyces soli]
MTTDTPPLRTLPRPRDWAIAAALLGSAAAALVTALGLLVGGVALLFAILRLRQRPPRTATILLSVAIAVWLLVAIACVAAGLAVITQNGTPEVVLETS